MGKSEDEGMGMNESCHTHKLVMSHVNESCHSDMTHSCVYARMSRGACESYVSFEDESCHM